MKNDNAPIHVGGIGLLSGGILFIATTIYVLDKLGGMSDQEVVTLAGPIWKTARIIWAISIPALLLLILQRLPPKKRNH